MLLKSLRSLSRKLLPIFLISVTFMSPSASFASEAAAERLSSSLPASAMAKSEMDVVVEFKGNVKKSGSDETVDITANGKISLKYTKDPELAYTTVDLVIKGTEKSIPVRYTSICQKRESDNVELLLSGDGDDRKWEAYSISSEDLAAKAVPTITEETASFDVLNNGSVEIRNDTNCYHFKAEDVKLSSLLYGANKRNVGQFIHLSGVEDKKVEKMLSGVRLDIDYYMAAFNNSPVQVRFSVDESSDIRRIAAYLCGGKRKDYEKGLKISSNIICCDYFYGSSISISIPSEASAKASGTLQEASYPVFFDEDEQEQKDETETAEEDRDENEPETEAQASDMEEEPLTEEDVQKEEEDAEDAPYQFAYYLLSDKSRGTEISIPVFSGEGETISDGTSVYSMHGSITIAVAYRESSDTALALLGNNIQKAFKSLSEQDYTDIQSSEIQDTGDIAISSIGYKTKDGRDGLAVIKLSKAAERLYAVEIIEYTENGNREDKELLLQVLNLYNIPDEILPSSIV